MAEEGPVDKLEFSENVDFKFSAAYEAYSKAFDEVSHEETKKKLNELVAKLSSSEMSYPRFYSELNQFREDSGGREFRRARISGQRKRAYRRDQIEKDRNKRHKR
jgi:hypothetical protein